MRLYCVYAAPIMGCVRAGFFAAMAILKVRITCACVVVGVGEWGKCVIAIARGVGCGQLPEGTPTRAVAGASP